MVTDDLYAYGIYGEPAVKVVTLVALVPGVGIGGREVAFRTHVPKGQIVKIQSAWLRKVLFGDSVYYVVTMDSTDIPPNVPVEIDLFGGNEGGGGDLNPRVYGRLP